jgi:hypothetical protein
VGAERGYGKILGKLRKYWKGSDEDGDEFLRFRLGSKVVGTKYDGVQD